MLKEIKLDHVGKIIKNVIKTLRSVWKKMKDCSMKEGGTQPVWKIKSSNTLCAGLQLKCTQDDKTQAVNFPSLKQTTLNLSQTTTLKPNPIPTLKPISYPTRKPTWSSTSAPTVTKSPTLTPFEVFMMVMVSRTRKGLKLLLCFCSAAIYLPADTSLHYSTSQISSTSSIWTPQQTLWTTALSLRTCFFATPQRPPSSQRQPTSLLFTFVSAFHLSRTPTQDTDKHNVHKYDVTCSKQGRNTCISRCFGESHWRPRQKEDKMFTHRLRHCNNILQIW